VTDLGEGVLRHWYMIKMLPTKDKPVAILFTLRKRSACSVSFQTMGFSDFIY